MYPLRRAILIGQLVVNLPMLGIIAAVWLYGITRQVPAPVSIAVGAILSWPYWSIAAPRWRQWALGKGVPAGVLQRAAVAAGLLWPKGWIFERSEIPPRKR